MAGELSDATIASGLELHVSLNAARKQPQSTEAHRNLTARFACGRQRWVETHLESALQELQHLRALTAEQGAALGRVESAIATAELLADGCTRLDGVPGEHSEYWRGWTKGSHDATARARAALAGPAQEVADGG